MLRNVSTGGEREVQRALNAVDAILAGRWKALILWLLSDGPHRYGDLAARIPCVTARVLTRQLRELEHHGIIDRWSATRGPRHVEYKLTDLGATLIPVLAQMHAWGARHVQEHDAWALDCLAGEPRLGDNASGFARDLAHRAEPRADLSTV